LQAIPYYFIGEHSPSLKKKPQAGLASASNWAGRLLAEKPSHSVVDHWSNW